ncbi:MAG: hypothetical protein ABW133_05495 [Polyangiaceae bacterium]
MRALSLASRRDIALRRFATLPNRASLPSFAVKYGAALATSLAVMTAAGNVKAQDRPQAPSNAPAATAATPPSEGARAIDPAAPPPSNVQQPPAGAPLPPLPQSGPTAPSETASTDAPPPPPPPPPEGRPRRPWFGGLGYATVGPFFGDLSTLSTALRAPDALGESYDIGSAALTLGGGGGAVLFGHLWVGGKGVGLLTAPFKNARGEALLTGGGGGFELGYVLYRPRTLIIPFFALGGYAYNVRVENDTGRPMPLQNVLTLAPGETRDIHAGFATIELGIRVQRLLFARAGGFIGGFEAGLLRSLSSAPWKSDGAEFVNHPGAMIEGGYIRFTVGGGGFYFK